jgi:YD repeat-containing protein
MNGIMRGRFPFIIALLMAACSAKSQYYYKDIILSKQNQENWKSLRDQKAKEVNIVSLDANDEPTPGFTCTQKISSDFSSISTYTKSTDIPESTVTTYYNPIGRLIKTVDTSDTFKSVTEYFYNEAGQLSSLLNSSVETDNQIMAVEKHVWIYENGSLKQMIKIKGESDSTIVRLEKDEKGNVVEEKPVHAGQSLPSTYYYYDEQGKLTDIVRYNQKAGRLLPDYIFEYNSGHVSSMLFVPSGSTDYQKWLYSYKPNGLKESEICYDKKRQVVVKINYTYNLR